MCAVLADYKPQLEAFHRLLLPECNKRILILRGQSGYGKTSLLTTCLEMMPPDISHIPFQLRSNEVNVAEIFYRTGYVLRWESLPRFVNQLAILTGYPKVDHNWLIGIKNHISIALYADTPDQREERRAALTTAWAEDVRQLDRLLLISIDNYEKAPKELQDWISSPFLFRITEAKQVRILIAGQEVPQADNIEWGHCCKLFDLHGVHEAEHWLPVVDALGLIVPVDPPLTYLAGVCQACEGRPDDIMKIIRAFPCRRPEALA